MNKKKIADYMLRADAAIQAAGIAKDGKVPSEFGGYISSFGAAIVQSGLLPTIAFFSRTSSSSKEDKGQVVKAIGHILDETELFNKVKAAPNDATLFQNIVHAAIALKLVLRTYPLTKIKSNDHA
jgi:CRISPR-associated protein Cmr5